MRHLLFIICLLISSPLLAMDGFLKQSTAVNVTVAITDSADHVSGKTGLTLTIYSSKAAAAPASISPTVTELDSTNAKGVYKIALTTGHTDTLGELLLHITSTGADPADYKWQIVSALPGDVSSINGISTSSVTTVNANVGQTQPVNFTGTGASALIKGDAIDWNSVAVTGMPMPTYTQPTGFLAATFPSGTVANTTNITAGTITTTTNLTNLPSIPANWITAAGITAAALNGKGDWNTTTPPTVAAIATGVWQDTTAGDFTTALSVGKSVMNGVSLGTGLTVNALTTNNDKTGYSLAANQHVIVDSGTVTTLTNLPSIPANWLTATGIAASALNGKGDWLTSGAYTAPPSVAAIATGVWQDTTAGDFTTALSVGKSVMNGVSLGTGLTINGYTGNTPQTGDAYARIGAAGAGLTAIGDTRIANLDAAVSSRMATFSLPTNFSSLAITGGGAVTFGNTTIATVTNLTNLPSIPANWLTATGIAASALNGKGDWLLASSYTAPDNTDAALAASNTANLQSLIENSGGYRFTTHALMQSPSGGSFDYGTMASTVWTFDLTAVSPSGQKSENLLKRVGTKP